MPKQDETVRTQLDGATVEKLLDRYRVVPGRAFDLKAQPTTENSVSKGDHAAAILKAGVARLSGLQDLLYANATWSLLVMFQAMDAGGKDSTIKHVMSGVNPQGVTVTSFKAPGPDDLTRDFLNRSYRALPARGMIGVFNRSHYEEVLVARVHPELVERQHLPPVLLHDKDFWTHRLDDIAAFERHLARQGTRIIKFFLNIGRDEQKKRFLSRLDHPKKLWKFSPDDIKERGRWDDYMAAYQAAIEATSTEEAPWYVIPADQKWFARLMVVEALNSTLGRLDVKPVKPDATSAAAYKAARARLEAEP